MKALLDMPVSPLLIEVLEEFGHTGTHVFHLGMDRANDEEILKVARQEGRIVITADLDFPRLLALSGADGPGVILFRGGSYSDAEMCQLLRRVLETVAPAVLKRSMCVVDHRKVRIARLPIRKKAES